MSGIFDKYLNMINGSRNTYGQMNTRTNTATSIITVNSKETYVPYQKDRRSSSVSSEISENDINEFRKNSAASINYNTGTSGTEIKRVLTEPNNRVNF